MRYLTAADGRAAFELGQSLGSLGVLAIGAEGGGLAMTLARTVGCGAALAGADALFHDGTTPAAGAWLAEHYHLPAAVYFLEEGERAALYLHDGRGNALEEDILPPPACRVGPAGSWDRLVGTDGSFAACRTKEAHAPGLLVAVLPAPGQKGLIAALERMGCEVLSRPRPGVPVLGCGRDGFSLTVRDGMGSFCPPGADGVEAAVAWCLTHRERQARPAFGEEARSGGFV